MIDDMLHTGIMSPISLTGMDSVRLMNRVDTKYLTDIVTLGNVLEDAAGKGYLIFENNGKRLQNYRSMYYDTPELQMYLDHHNCRLTRQKLRTRCYVDSGDTFLELKSKNNQGRTRKKRIEWPPALYCAELVRCPEGISWLDGRIPFNIGSLTPSLETSFSRITLVNPELTERSTIDMNLIFHNVRNGITGNLGDLVIIEVKQDGNIPSLLREILLERRVKPVRISKYCIGTAMTDASVRSGRFKSKLLMINKMMHCYD